MKREEALALADRLVRDMDRRGTLHVRLHGGPASGKSTTRAEVFAILKRRGRNVEDVPEYAKNLVWEAANGKLGFQPYIMAKQMWHMRRLEGQVDAIITDTSTLLSLIYGGPENGVTPQFKEYIVSEYRSTNGLDFFLDRNPNIPYEGIGRTQKSLSEAQAFDQKIIDLLDEVEVPYERVPLDENTATVIADRIDSTLKVSGNGTPPWEDAVVRARGDMELWEGGPPTAIEEAMYKFQ